jgi:hypothetical protein
MTVFGIHLTDYGPEALCALFIILVFLGYWVPRKDRDYWRDAALKSSEQVDKLIESVEPMVSIVKELKEQMRGQNGTTPKQGGEPS